MNWAVLWTFLKDLIIPLIGILSKAIEEYKAAQLRKQGREKLEKEILENEKKLRDHLDNVDPDGVSDDEAFGNR